MRDRLAVLVGVILLPYAAMAQTPPPVSELAPVTVVAAPLLPGLPDLTTVPSTAQVLDRSSLSRDGYPGLLRTLDAMGGGVSLNQAQGNPWQPNLIYHGFEASPLVGNAQGLATYLNGARFNQPFGDTTNWDLIPEIALDRVDLVGANPAFGLNALGGALSVRLRDGFTYHGAEATIMGGSFGRIQGSFQYGVEAHDTAAYIAGNVMHENGWRDFSPSTLRQIYTDIGWRNDYAELHVNILAADNTLVGNGTTPVDLLAVRRSSVFTYPDETRNRYLRIGLSGDYTISDATSVRVNAYYSNLSQRTRNGDAAEVTPCPSDTTVLCTQDGDPLTDRSGAQIANFITNSPYYTQYGFTAFATGGPYAFLNQTATDTNGYGLQAQVQHKFSLFGMQHRLTAGASYDGGVTEFTASTSLGGLSLSRGIFAANVVVAQDDGSITPVRASAVNNYYGLFATDTFDITSRLSGTVSARFNAAQIRLRDQIGTALNGTHSYNRLNPAIGFTYKILPNLTAYGGYAETNRAPTPAELSCADPQAPCSLTNFFVGDPALKQVVAHSFEAGLRGNHRFDGDGRLDWNVGYFHTSNSDDILFVASDTVGRAYFRNVGDTLRQGVEAGMRVRFGRFTAYADYAFTHATFQTALTLSSENNPYADGSGNIHVRAGNTIPGVPRHVFKIGADYGITDAWYVGFSALVASGKYLVGDEANLNPTTGAYGVLNIHSSYQIGKHVQLFGLIENVLNARYATFGTFSPVGSVPLIEAPGATNTTSLTAAPPIAGFAGVRVTF